MGNDIAKITGGALVTEQQATDIRKALQTSLYPGASDASCDMVLAYCRAGGLDPMTKPVHIVPIWDSKAGQMRDVVMPGVGLYRTIAARCGCAGIGEPEFGPDVTEKIGGQEITFPQWCKVTVKRILASGHIVEFTAKELWIENYAVKGGKEKSIAPNAMWTKRPYGQLAKCAEAQALRKGFPEIGAQPTADEMEGRELEEITVLQAKPAVTMPQAKAAPEPAATPSPESKPAAEAAAAPDVRTQEPGLHNLSDSQKAILIARAQGVGFDEKTLLERYHRIDLTNLNKVLAELRALSEAAQ
jgi:phage recombination protein Bet